MNAFEKDMLNTLIKVNELFNAHYAVSDDEEGGTELHDEIRALIAIGESSL